MFMKPFPSVLAGLFLLATVLVVFALARPNAKSAAPTASRPAVAAGLKVHVDPVTGRLASPPAKLAPDPAAQQLFNSSHDGLIEEAGTSAAGGFKVDPRGHFQSAITVRVGPDGKPVVNCVDQSAPVTR